MKESILRERLLELPLHNPALIEHARQRRQRLDNRIATFAGLMAFIWIHLVWFSVWIGSGLERHRTVSSR